MAQSIDWVSICDVVEPDPFGAPLAMARKPWARPGAVDAGQVRVEVGEPTPRVHDGGTGDQRPGRVHLPGRRTACRAAWPELGIENETITHSPVHRGGPAPKFRRCRIRARCRAIACGVRW
jgi:hypothetical protein